MEMMMADGMEGDDMAPAEGDAMAPAEEMEMEADM